MSNIEVNKINKIYKVKVKENELKGSLKSIFKGELKYCYL